MYRYSASAYFTDVERQHGDDTASKRVCMYVQRNAFRLRHEVGPCGTTIDKDKPSLRLGFYKPQAAVMQSRERMQYCILGAVNGRHVRLSQYRMERHVVALMTGSMSIQPQAQSCGCFPSYIRSCDLGLLIFAKPQVWSSFFGFFRTPNPPGELLRCRAETASQAEDKEGGTTPL
jgi:hypothetical protein